MPKETYMKETRSGLFGLMETEKFLRKSKMQNKIIHNIQLSRLLSLHILSLSLGRYVLIVKSSEIIFHTSYYLNGLLLLIAFQHNTTFRKLDPFPPQVKRWGFIYAVESFKNSQL
jgi:hypothetical protein